LDRTTNTGVSWDCIFLVEVNRIHAGYKIICKLGFVFYGLKGKFIYDVNFDLPVLSVSAKAHSGWRPSLNVTDLR
jgi:hypothetical protein